MKFRALTLLMLASAILSLTGCVPAWKMVRQDNIAYSVTAQGYSVNLPPGWLEIAPGNGAVTLLSLDGEDLDLIRISRFDNDKAMQNIKKVPSPKDLPAELADDFIASSKAAEPVSNLTVLVNEPATLGGKNGFHLRYGFSNPDGVRYQSDIYGVCTDNGFYTVLFRAPVLHYFDEHLGEFQKMVTSFQFLPMRARSG